MRGGGTARLVKAQPLFHPLWISVSLYAEWDECLSQYIFTGHLTAHTFLILIYGKYHFPPTHFTEGNIETQRLSVSPEGHCYGIAMGLAI